MSDKEQRLKEFYELRAKEEPESDPEADIRFRKALSVAELVSGEKVLDIGSKWGGLGAYARNIGLDIHYTGLDLSDENVRKATEIGLKVQQADISQGLPVKDAAYSCVFCMELLEHLMSPIPLLKEIRRVLRPQGRAIISIPNPYYWVEVYREFSPYPDPEGHLNSFTTPIMLNALTLAGLRVERRLGTYVRIPKTRRLVSTDSVLTRSRIYVIRPDSHTVFAGR